MKASNDHQSLIEINGHSKLQVYHFTTLIHFFKLENLFNGFPQDTLLVLLRMVHKLLEGTFLVMILET